MSALTIAGVVNRPSDRAANVAVVRLVNVPRASHRDLFDTLIVDRPATSHVLLVPDNLTHGPVGRAAHLRLTVIAARSACSRWAAIEASTTTVPRVRG